MIPRNEIEKKSVELGVNAADIQRDYVYSWFLLGLYSSTELGKQVVLKGGNALRKAYFRSARFSGDLDFGCSQDLSGDYIASEIEKACAAATAACGVTFDKSRSRVDLRTHGSDEKRLIHEAAVYFNDFYGKPSELLLTIRMDFGHFETLSLPIQTRKIIHPYSDEQNCSCDISCIKLEEAVASKLKCLIQRCNLSDLFDLAFTARVHKDILLDLDEIRSTFYEKTIFRRAPKAALELLHNLPLVEFREHWNKWVPRPIESNLSFEEALGISSEFASTLLASQHSYEDSTAYFHSALRNPIMIAGRKRTLLEVTYKGKRRLIEPYSLEFKTRNDGISREYLFAYDTTGGINPPGLRTLVRDGFEEVRNTVTHFEPRVPVELSKAGERPKTIGFERSGSERHLGHSSSRSHSRTGWTYLIRCYSCGRTFEHMTSGNKLRKHNADAGGLCYGRSGTTIDRIYR